MSQFPFSTFFLVSGTVVYSPYMNEDTKFEDLRMVQARSEDEALQKFRDYWELKGEPHGDSYSVMDTKATEPIL